jgi:hypothetical protein
MKKAAGAILMLVLCIPASAAPVTNNILDYYEITLDDGKQTIEIFFTLPVFYMSHFPLGKSDTLMVMVRPVAIAGVDGNSLSHREGLVVRQRDDVPLMDIEYEGENGFNSFLMVYFSREVTYTVSAGERFDSIRIELQN